MRTCKKITSMSNTMPDQKVLQRVTPNGKDPGLDPKIVKLTDFLDRAIRTQDPTVGTVIAAVGILLGRKSMNPDNLERLIHDVTTAIRVGFALHQMRDK